MNGLKSREGYVNVAPICMLYVNESKQLVPIAIQLKQGLREENTDNPIFLPSDNWIDWLLAKIYYQSAHSQVSIHHHVQVKCYVCYIHYCGNTKHFFWAQNNYYI